MGACGFVVEGFPFLLFVSLFYDMVRRLSCRFFFFFFYVRSGLTCVSLGVFVILWCGILYLYKLYYYISELFRHMPQKCFQQKKKKRDTQTRRWNKGLLLL
jgi:hypothetical protein